MSYYFDNFGWLSAEPIPGRNTEVVPPDPSEIPEGSAANFTGYKWIILPYTPPPAPEPSAIYSSIGFAVNEYMNQKAAERRYDNISSAVSYTTSTNAKYRAEAEACNIFRTACWEKCDQIELEVTQGLRPIPTPEEVVSELPDLVWPT